MVSALCAEQKDVRSRAAETIPRHGLGAGLKATIAGGFQSRLSPRAWSGAGSGRQWWVGGGDSRLTTPSPPRHARCPGSRRQPIVQAPAPCFGDPSLVPVLVGAQGDRHHPQSPGLPLHGLRDGRGRGCISSSFRLFPCCSRSEQALVLGEGSHGSHYGPIMVPTHPLTYCLNFLLQQSLPMRINFFHFILSGAR